jgi:hypothetical protein
MEYVNLKPNNFKCWNKTRKLLLDLTNNKLIYESCNSYTFDSIIILSDDPRKTLAPGCKETQGCTITQQT